MTKSVNPDSFLEFTPNAFPGVAEQMVLEKEFFL